MVEQEAERTGEPPQITSQGMVMIGADRRKDNANSMASGGGRLLRCREIGSWKAGKLPRRRSPDGAGVQ